MIKKIVRENWYYLLSIVFLIILFCVLKNSNYMADIQRFDEMIINYFNTYGTVVRTPLVIITYMGDWYLPVIIILLLLFIKKKNSYFLASFYAFSGILAYMTKYTVCRPRPEHSLITMPSTLSFPSGHALTSVCFYITFFYLITLKTNKVKRIFYLVLTSIFTLCIGFSRIYLGVHYFSDVIGGLILSIPCTLMFINIIKKNYKEAK